MAGEAFVELAVLKLHAALQAGFEAQLLAIESAQSLANPIPRPVAFVAARIEHDNRSPLIAVYDEGFDVVHQRQDLVAVDCTVALSMVGLPDLEALERTMRRYVTAVIRTIRAAQTLGAQSAGIVGAILKPGAANASFGDVSTTRLVYVLPVEVRVHSP